MTLSNEELVNEYELFHYNFIAAGTDEKEFSDARAELLARLERGEKAIKAMEMLIKDSEYYMTRAERMELLNDVIKKYKEALYQKGVSNG